jgi:osmoprotectant transport system substrate-binding protein
MKRIVLVLLIAFFAIGSVFAGGQQEKEAAVGSKNFTEQYIISEMMAQLLEAEGFKVSRDFGMASTAVRNALKTNQVDLYAEYTGTAWLTYLKKEEPINDPQQLFEEVKKADMENGLVWLFLMDLNNTYAMAAKKEFAQKHNLETLSDLAEMINNNPGEIKFAIDFEFYERPDGFFGMAEHYGMNIPKDSKNVSTMEIGLSYDAVDSGDVDVAMVFATDGKLKKYDMVVLKDDKQFFPVYSLCPVVHEDALSANPGIEDVLMPLKELVNEEVMVNLNYKVDAEGEEPEAVAEAFLKENGLID